MKWGVAAAVVPAVNFQQIQERGRDGWREESEGGMDGRKEEGSGGRKEGKEGRLIIFNNIYSGVELLDHILVLILVL